MQQALTLHFNGAEKTFEDLGTSPTVSVLVQALHFREDRVALELNGEIVSRALWPATTLKTGDRVELVHFVGGGAGTFSPSTAA